MRTGLRLGTPEKNASEAGHDSGDLTRDVASWAPEATSFVVTWVCFLALSGAWRASSSPIALTIYVSIVWTAPALISLRGIAGGVQTMFRMREERAKAVRLESGLLILCVPTVGREDILPALERSIESYLAILPAHVARFRIDVVIDEGSPAVEAIQWFADRSPDVRLIVVPKAYRTARSTRFKARANQYANELRVAEGESADDVWVLHMDDDTSIGVDTAVEVARFVEANPPGDESRRHLAQGVLSFPREHSCNKVMWLADSVRPGCDVSLFAVGTGRGHPHAGLHGELLLVRASVEASIGWDFGSQSTVEDAEFGLRFAHLYPGRSGWIPCRSYGASPATVVDFLRQRERWFAGLLRLSFQRHIPLRHRALIIHNVIVWSLAPLAYPGLVLLVAHAVGAGAIAPVATALLPVWATNVAFGVWLYWEGFKINVASSSTRPVWWERYAVVGLIPYFAFLECLAIARAIFGLMHSREPSFVVIAKPL
ncbi:MAG: glycosyltransferase family 2 protein [Nocardioides sp.]|nr:glycosyltransferase family 2 protein [Nocardioides sp.]